MAGFLVNLAAMLVVVSAACGPQPIDGLARLAHLGVLSLLAAVAYQQLRPVLPRPAARHGALVGAGLLGLHPSSAQVLADPAGRRVLLALLLLLAALVLRRSGLTGLFRWAYLVPVAAGVLCHPIGFLAVALMFLQALLEDKVTARAMAKAAAGCVPALAVAIASAVVAGQAGPAGIEWGSLMRTISALANTPVLAASGAAALDVVLWPLSLILAVLLARRRSRRPLAFAASWLLLAAALAPRQPVVACAGAALAAAWAIAKLLASAPEQRRWLVAASSAALLAACGTSAARREGGASPGPAEQAKGDGRGSASADTQVKAGMTPEDWLNLSLDAHRRGRYLESIAAAQTALRLRPDYADAYNNVAAGYSALRLWDLAIPAAQEAVRLKPENTLARNNLNWALEQKRLGVR